MNGSRIARLEGIVPESKHLCCLCSDVWYNIETVDTYCVHAERYDWTVSIAMCAACLLSNVRHVLRPSRYESSRGKIEQTSKHLHYKYQSSYSIGAKHRICKVASGGVGDEVVDDIWKAYDEHRCSRPQRCAPPEPGISHCRVVQIPAG